LRAGGFAIWSRSSRNLAPARVRSVASTPTLPLRVAAAAGFRPGSTPTIGMSG
jgi:hypothetical protein